jgi:hypothetical protein
MFCPSEAPLNPRLRPRPYLTTSTNPAQRVRAPARIGPRIRLALAQILNRQRRWPE